MVARVQSRRTLTPDAPPTGLLEGELSVELGSNPIKLWVGVPTTIDALGRRLLLPSGGVTIAEAAPVSPGPGTLWWESDTGIFWLWYSDPNSSQWVQVNGSPGGSSTGGLDQPTADGLYVNIAGDTMVGTLHAPAIAVDGLASPSQLFFHSNNQYRWAVNGTSGVNGDFTLASLDPTGLVLHTPLSINRANGAVTVANLFSVVTADGVAQLGPNALNLSTPAGVFRGIGVQTNGVQRWTIGITDHPETGANAGSNISISRADDAGNSLGTPFTIDRASGTTYIDYNFGNRVRQGTGGGSAGGFGTSFYNWFWDTAASNMQCWIDGTFVGSVVPASDYRIKKDIAPLSSMWEKVRALNPISYTHTDFWPPAELQRNAEAAPMVVTDDTERWGFIAHELQETLTPSAASGVKDQEDAIQSPNPFTVIAALTKALQEAMARIEELEIRVGVATPRTGAR